MKQYYLLTCLTSSFRPTSTSIHCIQLHLIFVSGWPTPGSRFPSLLWSSKLLIEYSFVCKPRQLLFLSVCQMSQRILCAFVIKRSFAFGCDRFIWRIVNHTGGSGGGLNTSNQARGAKICNFKAIFHEQSMAYCIFSACVVLEKLCGKAYDLFV